MYSAKNAEVQPKEHEGPPSKGGVWEVWTSQACITWNLHPRSIGSNNNVRKMLKNLEHVSKLIGELHKVWIYMLYIYQCISINTYTYIYMWWPVFTAPIDKHDAVWTMCIQSGLFHGGLTFPVSILNTSHPVAFPKNGAMARSRSGTFPPPDRSTTEIPGRQLPRQKGNLHLRSFILQWQ